MSQNPSIFVRQARPEQAGEIARIQSAAMLAHLQNALGHPASPAAQAAVAPAALEANWAEILRSPAPRGSGVLVATAGEEVVGFTAFGLLEDGAAEITALEVDPAHTRQGHGARLLAAATDILSAAAVQRVETWLLDRTEAHQRFYSSAGFAPAGMRRHLQVDDQEVREDCWHAYLQ